MLDSDAPTLGPQDTSRRVWLERAWNGAWGLGLCSVVPFVQAAVPSLHERRTLMGTLVDITLESPDAGRLKPALELAYQEMTRLSDMMNHYNPDSVVSAINVAAGIAPVHTPPELMRVLKMAQRVSTLTHGAFDITVASVRGWRFSAEHPSIPTPEEVASQLPLIGYRNLVLNEASQTAFLKKQGMRIDLGGIAKLYILDAGLRTMKQQGVNSAMINGGGDVLVMGGTQGRPWKVGIRDPLSPDKLMGVIALEHGIVASSGDYERFFDRDGRRYHHILDPKTGYPTTGPQGVTLVSDDLNRINGLGAAIMVMGAVAGRRLVQDVAGLDTLIVDRHQGVWMSKGMARKMV